MANFCQRNHQVLTRRFVLYFYVFQTLIRLSYVTAKIHYRVVPQMSFLLLSSFCIISVFCPVMYGHHCGSIQLICRATLRKVKKMVKNARQVSVSRPIFGGAYVRREICVSKSIGLACSGKEIYHFCFVLLFIRGQIPSSSPPKGLYSEGQFNRGFFALRFWGAYIWRGLYMDRLIFGIIRIAGPFSAMAAIEFKHP